MVKMNSEKYLQKLSEAIKREKCIEKSESEQKKTMGENKNDNE